jgi:NADP-dependent 3-hydroxy acid dehydrogenase YdfG
MPLEGRVVLITGASSGIGEATARAIVERGGKVVLGARREGRLAALVAELGAGNAVSRQTDVCEDADVQALVRLAINTYGRLDAVFANAGFGGGGTVADGDPSIWKPMILTNVYGVATTLHYAIPHLREAEDGHVVLISSIAGYKTPKQRNHMYSATKFAVRALADGLRQELLGEIRVTLVAPGMVDTEFGDWPEGAMTAEDIANLIVFALEQPERLALNEIIVRPVVQEF